MCQPHRLQKSDGTLSGKMCEGAFQKPISAGRNLRTLRKPTMTAATSKTTCEVTTAGSPPVGAKALSALARRFHGDAIADELQIESSGAANAVISRAVSVIRSRRLKQRQDVERWRRNQEKYLAESRAILAEADDAQYESRGDSSPRPHETQSPRRSSSSAVR